MPSVILALVMLGLLLGVAVAFWWQERQRMLLLKTATFLGILAGDGFQFFRFLAS